MNAGAALVRELTTNPLTTAIFGDRVSPEPVQPTSGLPRIRHQRISGPRQYTHAGDSGLQSPRYQLDVWAADPDTADAGAEAVVSVLSGREVAGIRFTTVLDDHDDYEPETGLYRRIVDVMPHLEN